MCGIIAAVAKYDVASNLLASLKRLEYRGYDSAGLATINPEGQLARLRVLGKVNQLIAQQQQAPLLGNIGIAHTRWATHGQPSVANAHPHICNNQLAIVHNGIIENYQALYQQQQTAGFEFESETDTEVIVNAIYQALNPQEDLLVADLLVAVFETVKKLTGAYALGVIDSTDPKRLIAVRKGSPLVIGIADDGYFIASDVFALLPITREFIVLEDGDIADIRYDSLTIYDQNRQVVKRTVTFSELDQVTLEDKGDYQHYMLKEIFEQPSAIKRSFANRIFANRIVKDIFGRGADKLFKQVKAIKMVACGTSYHAGLIAAYWMEDIAHISCQVEIASEYRYRRSVIADGTLFVVISQSGETADTLAALQLAKQLDYLSTLAICNVAESTLTREAAFVLLTHAGPELSVASTKALTTQLVGLFLLVLAIARHNQLDVNTEKKLVQQLESLPQRIKQLLQLKNHIVEIAKDFTNKHHALFLGRGSFLPVAMEGALKLKEVSYIHAEAYAAGELKHGPLALVDCDMPIIAVAPNNHLLVKLKSNLQEVRARNGQLYIFTDNASMIDSIEEGINVIAIDSTYDTLSPILYIVLLQLLAYYVAVIKGVDVDQPRNLAKSVTVE